MLIDETLEDYITDHIDPEPPLLSEVYRYTYLHHLYPRMCSGHYQGRLLKMLTAMVRPKRVLELGTFTGYSTLAIAEGLPKDGVIDTIEIDDEKEKELKERFENSPFAKQIRLHIGDALEVMKTLDGPYELTLIDANKRDYQAYLEQITSLVPCGGFILADNTLWDMKVTNPGMITDAQTKAIADFNNHLATDSRFEKVILPVRDGLTIIRRIK